MRAYRKYLTIQDPKQITLSDLPFEAGECVEVVVVIAEDQSLATRTETLNTLLKTTQALPHVHRLTEAELVAEIAAARTGR